MKKRLFALLLTVVMLLGCSCGSITVAEDPENTVEYVQDDSELTVVAAGGYRGEITGDAEKDNEIWDYAEACYNEWYERYKDALENGTTFPAEKVVSDAKQFDKKVSAAKNGASPVIYSTRTMSSLTDFTPKSVERDVYGGMIDASMRQEATGFFYAKMVGDRWWIVDPLGYLCVITGVSGMTYQYNSSAKQLEAMNAKYGTAEKWGIAATRTMMDKLYINARSVLSPGHKYLQPVPEKMVYQDKFSFVSTYENKIGARNNNSNSGSTVLLYGIHAFNPDFKDYCETYAAEKAASDGYVDDPFFLGYATDNEIPMNTDMLNSFLGLDLTVTSTEMSVPINCYSYACAWTFLAKRTGKDNPTIANVTTALQDQFRGFVYDRYFSIVAPIVRKVDPNHMVLGCRGLNGVRTSEWVCRATGYWCDVVTINWYQEWTPEAGELYDVGRYAGKPLIITEFYTKATENEGEVPNQGGAGWLVETQKDRGMFYQNYVLRLLECKNCVGWYWFQYIDNDPDANGKDSSNKGIFSSFQNMYQDLADAMIELNKNVYGLIAYFDAK